MVGNRTAWEAYASLGRKLAGKANKSAVLALVKIEQEQGSSKGQGSSSSSREGKAGAEQQPQQEDVEGSQQQQQVQGGKQQQQKGAGYRLSMLIVHDEDVQRSIMQVGGWVGGGWVNADLGTFVCGALVSCAGHVYVWWWGWWWGADTTFGTTSDIYGFVWKACTHWVGRVVRQCPGYLLFVRPQSHV